jgi:hypothetical protein
MARPRKSGYTDLAAVKAQASGVGYSFTLYGRSWEIRPDVPMALLDDINRLAAGPAVPDDPDDHIGRAQAVIEWQAEQEATQVRLFDQMYGPGSHADLITRGGSDPDRQALLRGAIAWYFHNDPEQAATEAYTDTLGDPADPAEVGEDSGEALSPAA